MLPVINWADPRLQPCAYVTTGKTLFEVLSVRRDGVADGRVLLENCRSLERLEVGPRQIVPGWALVKAAPGAPDVLEAA